MWGPCRVQASHLSFHVQEPPLHVPYCPGHGAWIIQHLPLRRKRSIAVVTHMPWLCSSLMSSAQCWLHHSWWCCHDPLGHLWTLLWNDLKHGDYDSWKMNTNTSLPQTMQESVNDKLFFFNFFEFCCVNGEQHIFQLCPLLNSLECNHCIPRMGTFSMLTTPCIPHTATRGKGPSGKAWKWRVVPYM